VYQLSHYDLHDILVAPQDVCSGQLAKDVLKYWCN